MFKHLHLKPRLLALIIALFMGASGTANLFAQTISQGAVSGHAFTVNADGDQVLFSQGNLQYIGSASTPYWKFAEHQWDCLGTTTGQNSSDENVDRDLFGWGTSGYDHGAVCYQPWSTSQTNSDYFPYGYGSVPYNLFDQTGQADWGYNAISNGGNTENSGWRTLTKDEWVYLFNTRSTTSGIRYAKANVNNVNGVVLLPDDWSSSYYTLNSTNTSDANFTSNTITESQWNTLEQHGAVFLPDAGYREGNTVIASNSSYYYDTSKGYYWSASCNGSFGAWDVYFRDGELNPSSFDDRTYGRSVRLVLSAENYSFGINATPNPAEGGTVSGGGAHTVGTDCTLTATPSAGYAFVYWTENRMIVSSNTSYTFTVNGERNLVANFVLDDNISFADENVKNACVAPATGWDTNQDGELSYTEAAAVTSIGEVFKNNTNITSFNELQYFISLTSIDAQAFRGCSALAEITIPEQVVSIGNRAFWDCPALTTVHFNAIDCTTMSTKYDVVDYSVFMSSGDPATFPLTNLTIGSNVQNIPDYAFKGCSALSSDLNLPNTVATVGQYAFYGCTNLATLTIGEGVETIGKYAFWNCPNLQTVHFNAVNCTSIKTITGSNPYSSDLSYCCSYSVFNSGTSEDDATPIVTLTIGENVTRIPEYAFRNSTNAEGGLTLPSSVTTIGEYAFYGCTGFTSGLTLGNSVTTIGRSAFCDCTGFTGGLVIPNSVTTIGKEAFSGCTGFTGNLTIGNSVTTIEESAFLNCTGFTGSLVIPSSLTTIGKTAFASCRGFTGSLVIPNSVTTIGESAFNSCRGFTGNLVIPNSVTTIEGGAFYNCSGFTGSLVIPNSVTSIGFSAFYGCSGFDGVLIIGRKVSSLGGWAFSGCSGFTALISERVTPPKKPTQSSNYDIFPGMNYSIPAYVPNKTNYESATDWSNFTSYQNQIKFTNEYGDNKWSNDDNWSNYDVPGSSHVVCITENCQLEENANVLYVYIADDEKVLTIDEGKALNTTYGMHIEDAEQLVVGDGGQVKSNIPFCGTMKKDISAWTTEPVGGWQFIASPLNSSSLNPEDVANMITPKDGEGNNTFDLFQLDMNEDECWRNYRVSTFNLANGKGYLYANASNKELSFAGELLHGSSPVSVSGLKANDFNLVGNPYSFNAYLSQPYYSINDANSGITAQTATSSGAIAPCTGVIVRTGENVTSVEFSTSAPNVTSTNPGNIQMMLAQQVMSRGESNMADIDNAIVSFKDNEELPKFYFGNSDANIYIPQDGKEFAIVSSKPNGSMPVNFRAMQKGTYTLTVYAEDAEMNYLHLVDNMTGADVDLLSNPSYTFEAGTNDYESRFTLMFSNSNNGNEDGDEAFAFVSNGNIIVAGTGTLQVVDMTGRIVSTQSASDHISTNGLAEGVYVLRLINGDNVRTQKIVVK